MLMSSRSHSIHLYTSNDTTHSYFTPHFLVIEMCCDWLWKTQYFIKHWIVLISSTDIKTEAQEIYTTILMMHYTVVQLTSSQTDHNIRFMMSLPVYVVAVQSAVVLVRDGYIFCVTI